MRHLLLILGAFFVLTPTALAGGGAEGAPVPSGPPSSENTVSAQSASPQTANASGVSPDLVNVTCTIPTGLTVAKGIFAQSTISIKACFVNGVPTAWTGVAVKTVLQQFEHGIGWVTTATGNGADSAKASSACKSGTSWQSQGTATVIADGVILSGGPFPNSNTC